MAGSKVVSTSKGNFLGATKGNSAKNTNLTKGGGGSGEGHSKGGGGSKFLGPTKGNTNLPTNRTAGVSSGRGSKAGGKC